MKNKIKNICSNIILLISYTCFLILNYQLRKGYILGIIVATGVAIFFLSRNGQILKIHNEAKRRDKILSLLGTVGILFTDAKLFYQMMLTYDKADKLIKLLHVPKNGFLIGMSLFLTVMSFTAVYILLLYFYTYFLDDVLQIVIDLSPKEQIALSVLFLIGVCFVVGVYMITGVFYGNSGNYDVIYTSDSGIIFLKNCFLWLSSGQNDFRQPMFAVISAPFVGVFSVLSIPFALNSVIVACITQIVNVMALFLIIVMISELLGLKGNTKILFWIMTMTIYPVLLFDIMVEQYIFVVFWLLFFIRMTLKKGGKQDICFIGAVGGLVTNAVLLPLLFYKDRSVWKERAAYVWKTFLKGIFAILIFSRFDIILTLIDGIKGTLSFTGQGLSFREMWYQYTIFVRSCFIAPEIVINTEGELPTWQLAQATHVEWLGVVIFLLLIVSFYINRKDIICQIAFGWTFFSFILLSVVGYGASENGMILYSLYFGWAFWILIFKLLQSILKKLKCREYMLQICIVAFTIVLCIFNMQGMRDMIAFAKQFYPY